MRKFPVFEWSMAALMFCSAIFSFWAAASPGYGFLFLGGLLFWVVCAHQESKRVFLFEPVSPEARRHPNPGLMLPSRATQGSAAYDLYAPSDVTVRPFEVTKIWTDVKALMPEGYVLLVNVRSSMGKVPLMLANTQGWIDRDYYGNPDNDGNICVMLYNIGPKPYEIKAGDRIAQAMFVKCARADHDLVLEDVRTGGVGSSGK